jgi:hypothetical protein
MFDTIAPAPAGWRRRPLAACAATLFCVSATATAAAATIWTVDSCNEASVGSGTTGSLRYAAANAVSGDTIDMTGLACSTITLATGSILLPQTNITLQGPGKDALTVDGGHGSRVFQHTGSGTLGLYDLTVANGYFHAAAVQAAYGGCIYSNGSVSLAGAGVRSCSAIAGGAGARAKGGGIFARKSVYLFKYSEVSDNTASAPDTYDFSYGGGVFALNDLVLGSSTISGNHARLGGGARVFGNTTITASTISGNTAGRGGGIYARNFNPGATNTFSLANSTVSGNQALGVVGGVWTNAGTINVHNSTIAFNTAAFADPYSRHFSPGLNVDDVGAYYTDISHYKFKVVTLQSSVLSNNVSGTSSPAADDFGVTRYTPGFNLVPTSGQNNLVLASSSVVPADTITGVCPGLGPLRDNGGPTRTHALLGGSPAIDHGNNTVPYAADQRGSPFQRVSGAAADIGAYEVQQEDIVFIEGFDGPPTCPSG